ncbi:MAG: heavy metal translocating P-type ATPase metal-binding domain-containing protein [Gemmatimonadaceae bacterium]
MATEVLREAEPNATSPTSDGTVCAHCGLPVYDAFVFTNETKFCCSGCRTAFAILSEHGLAGYYKLRERRDSAVVATHSQFAEFDHPTFAASNVQVGANGIARTELYLEGVHCASCVWLVERMPMVVPGVIRAELDVRRSLAVVEWDATTVALSAIARSLDLLGYTPHPFRGVARNELRNKETRAMLVRIGIAGAIAINVMLATLALYSGEVNGMDPSFTRFFRWVSLAVTIPSFIWPARVFFTSAFAALRARSMHMDVPIAVALSAGFIRGAINTITDSGPIYFDGLAILIFALLVGRFLQQRGQRMASDATEMLNALAPVSARVIDSGVVRTMPVDALVPGMLLDVRAGESFPADGVVTSGASAVNGALLTGESRPVRISVESEVFAGTLNVEAPLQVRVTHSGAASRIARLLQEADASSRRRVPIVQMANRMASAFVVAVLAMAVTMFAIKVGLNSPHALDDAIALLIVTCPCALALATPLAITVAVGRAARRGILIKGGDTLEILARPATFVLDKTGTITEGKTALVSWFGPEWVKPLVLALENGSSHPIAEGFRDAWNTETHFDTNNITVNNVRHVLGGGVEGTVNGHHVQLGSPRFIQEAVSRNALGSALPKPEFLQLMNAALTPVHVAVDGVLVASASMGDRIRADALASLTALRNAGWHTMMLTGDTTEVAQSVGYELGFSVDEVVGGATPEFKLAFVEQLKVKGAVVMVGDGVNDAAAIAAASVGIGVHGGAQACLATADIYTTRGGLLPLVELTEGAARTMRVIRRNIAFSLLYNAVGAGLAVAGLLTPLIAAVLMPASSLTVVLASWRSFTFSRSRS